MANCFCTKTYQCLACEDEIKPKVKRTSQRKIAQCGTRAGYSRHLKMGEPTCVACKAAQTEAVKKYQREKALK